MAIEGLPFTTLPYVILTTGPFVFLWSYLKAYVEKNGPFRWVDALSDAHHFLVAGASLFLAAHVADIGHDFLVTRTGYQLDPNTLGYLYHLLKLYEYFDVLLAILAGDTLISKYTAFSHLALPYWSYYRVISNHALDWRFQVIADCSVRFLSRAVPWLVPDVETEELIVNMAEDWRWYPDLAISAFWATFLVQGIRDEKMARDIFGPPQENEMQPRLLSLAILLYGGHLKRKEDKRSSKSAQRGTIEKEPSGTIDATEKSVEPSNVNASSNDVANAIRLPQTSRRKR